MRGLIVSIFFGILAGVCSVAIMPFFFAHEGAGLILPGFVLFLVSARRSRGIAFIISAGVVLDSYAFYTIEVHTVRLLVLALIAFFIFTRWLTNRSFYSALALSMLLTLLDQFFRIILYLFQNTSGLRGWSWSDVVWVFVFHACVTAFGFFWIGVLTKRLSIPLDRTSTMIGYG